ncbi:MAG: hypothetical protein KBG42_05555 [Lachnospiraceae bacterium]|nr:hypothetical protein [Lachnospiraceae bacterium]
MKKSKKKLTFASSAIAAGAMFGLVGCPSGCVYGPPQDGPQPDVYGPPEFIEENIDEPVPVVYGPPEYFDENLDQPEEPVYGPPPVDIDEPIEEVYGPPEDFEYDGSVESSASPDGEDGKERDDSVSNPEDDIDGPMVTVYGPPEP